MGVIGNGPIFAASLARRSFLVFLSVPEHYGSCWCDVVVTFHRGLKAPGLSLANFSPWQVILTMVSLGSILDVELVLEIFQCAPDRRTDLSGLLQRLDLASKESKFVCLGIGTGLGVSVTSSSQQVPLGWTSLGCRR